jgi:hypothetical protein
MSRRASHENPTATGQDHGGVAYHASGTLLSSFSSASRLTLQTSHDHGHLLSSSIRTGDVELAFCWSHVPRQFYEIKVQMALQLNKVLAVLARMCGANNAAMFSQYGDDQLA